MMTKTVVVGTVVLVLAMAVGVGVLGVSPPIPGEAAPPATETSGEPVTTSPGLTDGPTMSVSHAPAEELQLGNNVTVMIDVTEADGTPAAGTEVAVQSLGWQPGYFLEETPVRTDRNGTATVTWHFTVPDHEDELMIRTLGGYPPSETVSIYASATVNGGTAEGLTTFRINPKCQNCHRVWRDQTTMINNTETFP